MWYIFYFRNEKLKSSYDFEVSACILPIQGALSLVVLPFHWLESNIVSVNIAANSFCIFYPDLF